MIRVVLDSGALSAWAARDPRVIAALEATRRDGGSAVVPTVVVAESTTGEAGRDAATNRALKGCTLDVCDETRARRAAALRHRSRAARQVSVVDAVVAATGEAVRGPVLTSDPRDLRRLAGASPGLRILSLDQLA